MGSWPLQLTGCAVALWLFVGCPDSDTFDVSPDGDDDSETSHDDDDSEQPADPCDEHPGEILCDGEMEIVCDEAGDVVSNRDCEEALGEFCVPGLGCTYCDPGDRFCVGPTIVECDADGLGVTTIETCVEAMGEECLNGACVNACAQAASQQRNDGCSFLAVDMEISYFPMPWTYGVVVAASRTIGATVDVETKVGDVWDLVATEYVGSGGSYAFRLPNLHTGGSAVTSNAYRITSTAPVYAWQFNPLDEPSGLTDASLLFPVVDSAPAASQYHIPGWAHGVSEEQGARGTLNVLATADGSVVTVTPSAATDSGVGIGAGEPGVAMTVTLDEGENLQLVRSVIGEGLAGTVVQSDGAPVAVFSGHTCAYVPAGAGACNHLEEQVFDIRLWGSDYIAARFPQRTMEFTSEPVHWQIVAGDEPVQLTFSAAGAVLGLPQDGQLALAAREAILLEVSGNEDHPGDFRVSGDQPFLLAQYSVGWSQVPEPWTNGGDPSMVQVVPIDAYRDAYLAFFLDRSGWRHHLVVTRSLGSSVRVDSEDLDSMPDTSERLVDGEWEVVRVLVAQGLHDIEADAPVGLMAGGWQTGDAYWYPGGYSRAVPEER